MDPLLGREEPVRVLAPRDQGRGLDPGLLPRARLEKVDLEAPPLGPAHLHPQQHLGPVLGVGAAGAGVHRDDRVAGVVASREEPLLLELRQARLDVGARLLQLGGDRVVLGRELLQRLQVVELRLQHPVGLELALRARVLRRDARRPLLVVPEAGLLHLALERAYALG